MSKRIVLLAVCCLLALAVLLPQAAQAKPKLQEVYIVVYNESTQTWQMVSKGDLLWPVRTHDAMFWQDDFLEAAAVLASTVYSKAHWTSGGTNGTATITAGAPSLMALATSGTAQNDTSTLTFTTADFLIAKNPILEMRVILSAITDVVMDVGWYVDANDECIFRFSSAVNANHIYTVYENNNGGEVLTDSTVHLVAGTAVTFRLELLSTGGFKAYINDALVKTGAASAIRTVAFKPYFYVKDPAAGHPGRTLSIDYVKIWQDR